VLSLISSPLGRPWWRIYWNSRTRLDVVQFLPAALNAGLGKNADQKHITYNTPFPLCFSVYYHTQQAVIQFQGDCQYCPVCLVGGGGEMLGPLAWSQKRPLPLRRTSFSQHLTTAANLMQVCVECKAVGNIQVWPPLLVIWAYCRSSFDLPCTALMSHQALVSSSGTH
jgi:hypothetical protein